MANKIKGLYNRFTLIGELNYKEDRLMETNNSNDGRWRFTNSNFGVKTSEGNYIYCELKGMYSVNGNNIIKTYGIDNKEMIVAFEDRLNPTIVNNVASYRKTKINLTSSNENESKEFLSNHDAVPYFVEQAKLYPKVRVVVEGNCVINRYKDKQGNAKIAKKYEVQNIRLAKDEEVNKAEIECHFVFGDNAWDDSNYSKDNKKVDINSYMTFYDNVRKETFFTPMNLTLDLGYLMQKSDGKMTEDMEKMLLNMYEKNFKGQEGVYYETKWKVDVLSGSTKVEIKESDFNDNQKLQIMAGILTKEEVIAEMGRGMNGDKIDELKLIRPLNIFDGDTKRETLYTLEDFFIAENSVENKDIFKTQSVPKEADIKTAEQDINDLLFGKM